MTIIPKSPCAFCGHEAQSWSNVTFGGGDYDVTSYDCPRCGRYVFDWLLGEEGLKEDDDRRFRVACLAAERKLRGEEGLFGVFSGHMKGGICEHLDRWWQIDDLAAEFPGPTELIDRALVNLSRTVDHPMQTRRHSPEDLPFLLFCPGRNVSRQLIFMDQMGLLAKEAATTRGIQLTIAPKGWERIDELASSGTDSRQGFVAMWFTDDRDPVFKEGILPAIEEAGYDAKRIDTVEHNNKICDEIIAEIRRSRFVVADFTGQRGGVYFEAGFARGLRLPVISIVHKNDVDKLHFDTRQYNHIVYETPEDLKQKLYNRIAATIH